MRRFPARDSRWRSWSPDEASNGAVPFQDAKWPRSGNRVMSPTSTEQPRRAGRADAVECGQGRCRSRRAARSAPCSPPSCARRSRSRSPTSSAATWRRVLPATSRGRTVGSSAWPALRTGPSSPRRGSARAAGGAAARPSGCGPDPARRGGRPAAAARRLLVIDHRPQAGHPDADHRDRVGVDRVGLAALSGANTRARADSFAGTSTTCLAVGDQAQRDVAADRRCSPRSPTPGPATAGAYRSIAW